MGIVRNEPSFRSGYYGRGCGYLRMTKVDRDRVALRAFFNIAKVWGLTDDEQLSILGQPDQTTFDA